MGNREEEMGNREDEMGYREEKMGYREEKMGYREEKMGYREEERGCRQESVYFGATVLKLHSPLFCQTCDMTNDFLELLYEMARCSC